MDKKDIFPQIKKGIEDFMQEEEGNISSTVKLPKMQTPQSTPSMQ